jgi:hypothetical protein
VSLDSVQNKLQELIFIAFCAGIPAKPVPGCQQTDDEMSDGRETEKLCY